MLDFLTNIPAAGWAAIAAGLSAVSALMMLKVQRRSFLESIKPELVIEGWDRREGSVADQEVFSFNVIRNVGKGPAHRVFVSSYAKTKDRPICIMDSMWVPIIPAGESHETVCKIRLFWKNVPLIEGFKYMSVNVTILAWDSYDNRYETVYPLFIDKADQDTITGSDRIAPNVSLTHRKVSRRRVWTLKLQGRIKRLTKMPRQVLKSIQNKLLPRSKSQ